VYPVCYFFQEVVLGIGRVSLIYLELVVSLQQRERLNPWGKKLSSGALWAIRRNPALGYRSIFWESEVTKENKYPKS
jgi:hypothetical protein